jgi:hypothetical protein
VAGEFVALLAKVTEPLTLPVTVGANTALKLRLPPPAMVCGKVSPLMLNPAPVTVAWEMVTLPVPVLLRTMVCDVLLFTTTLPKAILAGEAESCSVTPVPLKPTVSGDPAALLVMLTLPLSLPVAAGAKVAVKGVDCPAESVSGTVSPLRLKPVPVADAAVTVTLAVPVLVSVTVCASLLPTATLPKLTLVGDVEICSVTPVPLKATVFGEPVALLVIVMAPVALPVDVGANFAVNGEDCPAVKVSGRASPLRLKPVPLAEAAVTVTLAVPGLVRVTVCEPLPPTVTLPKFTLAGEAESCSVTPVPLRATVLGEPVALLVMVMAPVALPVVAGAKVAVKGEDWPAANVSGRVSPLRLKPVPVAEAAVTVTLAVPVFVRVTVCGLLLPTVTLPKFTLAGETESCSVTPAPLSATVVGVLEALLVIATLPVALPLEVGANDVVKAVVCPAARVSGTLRPLRLNPAPLTVAWVIVTPAKPVLVRVTL